MTLKRFMPNKFLEWNDDTKKWKKTVEDEATLNLKTL